MKRDRGEPIWCDGFLVEADEQTAKDLPGRALVATSGFAFDNWNGPFYPHGLLPSSRHAFYSERMRGVEINATFYDTSPGAPDCVKNFASWRSLAAAHPPYEFVVKVARALTHSGEPSDETVRAKLTAYAQLRPRGLLFQFPPKFSASAANVARVQRFIKAMADFPFFGAFEFRNVEWQDEKPLALFEAAPPTIGMVQMHCTATSSWTGGLPEGFSPSAATYDKLMEKKSFRYVRLHGALKYSCGEYGEEFLKDLAQRMRPLCYEKDVTVMFNNTDDYSAKTYLPSAVQDAMTLARLLMQ